MLSTTLLVTYDGTFISASDVAVGTKLLGANGEPAVVSCVTETFGPVTRFLVNDCADAILLNEVKTTTGFVDKIVHAVSGQGVALHAGDAISIIGGTTAQTVSVGGFNNFKIPKASRALKFPLALRTREHAINPLISKKAAILGVSTGELGYIFGLWLGDGCFEKPAVTMNPNDDKEAIGEFTRISGEMGVRVAVSRSGSNCNLHAMQRMKGPRPGSNWPANSFRGLLKELALDNNIKSISRNTMFALVSASANFRRAVLAGLIDSDGSLSSTTHKKDDGSTSTAFSLAILQAVHHSSILLLAWQLAFSLGTQCSFRYASKISVFKGSKTTVHRIDMHLNCTSSAARLLPIKITRKQVPTGYEIKELDTPTLRTIRPGHIGSYPALKKYKALPDSPGILLTTENTSGFASAAGLIIGGLAQTAGFIILFKCLQSHKNAGNRIINTEFRERSGFSHHNITWHGTDGEKAKRKAKLARQNVARAARNRAIKKARLK